MIIPTCSTLERISIELTSASKPRYGIFTVLVIIYRMIMPKDPAAAMMYGILLSRLFFSIQTATIIEAIPTIMKNIFWPPGILGPLLSFFSIWCRTTPD